MAQTVVIDSMHPLAESLIEHYDTPLKGEYWYTSDGELIFADGDAGAEADNHSLVVCRRIINMFCDAAGVEDVYDGDVVMFRSDLGDMTGGFERMIQDYVSKNNIDDVWDVNPWDVLRDKTAFEHQISPKLVELMSDCIGGGDSIDPREFAIKYWKWVRIHGTNFELPSLKPNNLKRVAEAVDSILDEENEYDVDADTISVTVSTYEGKRTTAKVGDLRAGLLDGADADEQARKDAARRQVDAMDQAIAHPYYTSSGG